LTTPGGPPLAAGPRLYKKENCFMPGWILFVIGAVLSWGAYGPALHEGRAGFLDPKTASLRALLCVGVAYFLVAVLVPLALLWSQEKLPGFTVKGSLISTLAGVLGAAGAVCIIFVMPLVFGGAPIVNGVINLAMKPSALAESHWLLYVGFVLAAVGAGLILWNLPS
jgi:hypothetical protein